MCVPFAFNYKTITPRGKLCQIKYKCRKAIDYVNNFKYHYIHPTMWEG